LHPVCHKTANFSVFSKHVPEFTRFCNLHYSGYPKNPHRSPRRPRIGGWGDTLPGGAGKQGITRRQTGVHRRRTGSRCRFRLVIIYKNSPGGTGSEQAPDPVEKLSKSLAEIYPVWLLQISLKFRSARKPDPINPGTNVFVNTPASRLPRQPDFLSLPMLILLVPERAHHQELHPASFAFSLTPLP